ncbi:hypothetical protein [Piscirickettsia litoralis]|uniref:Uncharacterized protein n=1 Tax=Piscirickettsia litoralis TaxID=1891921 RepID=A0ABX3A6K9_9GAMM|nr:hypothetical protein [Piscirickettsia litoralis]ODN43867.1 hypothetical protein BGC07_14445 [Piscirickettsia litoralis]
MESADAFGPFTLIAKQVDAFKSHPNPKFKGGKGDAEKNKKDQERYQNSVTRYKQLIKTFKKLMAKAKGCDPVENEKIREDKNFYVLLDRMKQLSSALALFKNDAVKSEKQADLNRCKSLRELCYVVSSHYDFSARSSTSSARKLADFLNKKENQALAQQISPTGKKISKRRIRAFALGQEEVSANKMSQDKKNKEYFSYGNKENRNNDNHRNSPKYRIKKVII